MPSDSRKFKAYWKQQRGLKQLELSKSILEKTLDMGKVFVSSPMGALVASVLVLAAVDRTDFFGKHSDAYYTQAGTGPGTLLELVIDTIIKVEVISSIASAVGGASGIGSIIAALK